jgi:hypothetical protein
VGHVDPRGAQTLVTEQRSRPTGVTARDLAIVGALLCVSVVVFAQGSIPQAVDYHVMADQRPCIGIANCLNVLSNIPFAIVGIWGLAMLFGAQSPIPASERWPYTTLFAGVAATAVGSSYYHLSPDNARLVWDRLPMTLGFMGLLSALIAERVSAPLGRALLWPLVVFGAASVWYWYWTELHGAGDLRLYVIVQFGSLLVVTLLLVLYSPRFTGSVFLWAGLAAYAGAKLFELADYPIFTALGGTISGHTLKHLSAAAAVAAIAWMIRRRTALSLSGPWS